MWDTRKVRQLARILAIIAILGTLAFVGIFFVPHLINNARIDIIVAPQNAQITINGKSYTNGYHAIRPGNAKVSITADGYQTKELEIELKPHQNLQLHAYLLDSDGGLFAYTKSRNDYELLKLVANDDTSISFVNNYESALRIKTALPITYYYTGNNQSYSQSFSALQSTIITDATDDENCHSTLCLKVSGEKKSQADAEFVLKQSGLDIKYYDVFYE